MVVRRARIVLVSVVAAALGAAACRKAGPVTPVPPASADAPTVRAPTASAAAPAKTPAEDAAEIAAALARGAFAEVRARFDDAMQKALTAAQLESMWRAAEEQFGSFVEQVGVIESEKDGHAVATVTIRLTGATLDVRIVFDEARRIIGMVARPSQVATGPRPQTPKPPFAYEEREVAYPNPVDGSTLAGTLTLPPDGGPHPAVLLITGSGVQDRDETLFGHKPFLVIADQLTNNGIAVLRVDDRGIGKTTGQAQGATVETHATDVEAGIAFLAGQKDIDPQRIGLIGHSEGGILAAVVAARRPDVAFVVSLAGTGLPGAEINPLQVEAIMRAQALPEPSIHVIVEAQRKLMGLIAKDAPDADIRAAVREAFVAANGEFGGGAPVDDAQIDARVQTESLTLLSPWYRSFVKLDPAASWSQVRVPVLVLIGDRDVQVPADANLAAIEKALKKAGNKRHQLSKLPGLNHLFQTAKTGLVEEYGKLEETFAPSALELMTAWLRKQAQL